MRVTVIGGGGAALLAAISAAEAGAEVSLVSKTPVGFGSCTAHSGGAFTLAAGGTTPAAHYDMTMSTGKGLNDARLVSILAEQAPRRVADLARYGVELKQSPSGARAGENLGELVRGLAITRPLTAYARKMGVRILDRTAATRIVMEGDGPRAVDVMALSSGEALSLPCRAVVVATGGAGRIYRRTDNPVRTTGDGHRLLAETGATFRDMEFVQFYPLGFDEPGFPVWAVELTLLDYCRLTNARGEPFLEARFKQWGISSAVEANLRARDLCALETARELEETGKVELHLEEVDLSRVTSPRDRGVLDALFRMFPPGRSHTAGPVGVSPVQHYFCGGVVTDEECGTGVPGVYACGEVVGGLDGANRLGGNALTSLAVFGPIAGASAARFALSSGDYRYSGSSRRWRECPPPATVNGQIRVHPEELKRQIRLVCDRYLGPIRNAAGLRKALDELGGLEAECRNPVAATPRESLEGFEAGAMLLAAEMVATAALHREESRGVHFRSDFPWQDAGFDHPTHIRVVDGRPIVIAP
ncbi:MAG: FAD-binding protein [Firmicutes bacterium]|jgi:succinate dehydrogenase/fumarate reductase flavoprotein subunit|nr:FAD-binding protein [Bacillota bacterium]